MFNSVLYIYCIIMDNNILLTEEEQTRLLVAAVINMNLLLNTRDTGVIHSLILVSFTFG